MNERGCIERGSVEEALCMSLARSFKEKDVDPEVIAEILYLWGVQQSCTTFIDEVTFEYGYGELDGFGIGCFEFPLPRELCPVKTIWNLDDAFRYEKGQRVNESRFGEGVVLEANGLGNVTVEFDHPISEDKGRICVVSMFSLRFEEDALV